MSFPLESIVNIFNKEKVYTEKQLRKQWQAALSDGFSYSKFKDLIQRGIPDSIRGDVWCCLLGNSCQIKQIQYDFVVAQVVELTENRLISQVFEQDALHPKTSIDEDGLSIDSISSSMYGAYPSVAVTYDDDEEEDEWVRENVDEDTLRMVREQIMGNSMETNSFLKEDSFSLVTPPSPSSLFSTQDSSSLAASEEAFSPDSPASFELNETLWSDFNQQKEQQDEVFEAQDEETEPMEGSTSVSPHCSQSLPRSISLSLAESDDPGHAKLLKALPLLRTDLPRTYPEVSFFHDGHLVHKSLELVLMAHCVYSPNFGYVQGMSYLVGHLLLYLSEFKTFLCFENLLEKKVLQVFYSLDKEKIDIYVLIFNYYFQLNLPKLYRRFQAECIFSEVFVLDWYLSLFSKALPLGVLKRVWDMFFLEDELYLLKVALSILRLFEKELMEKDMVEITRFLQKLPTSVTFEALSDAIDSLFHMHASHYAIVLGQIEKEYEKRVKKALAGKKSRKPTVHPLHLPHLFFLKSVVKGGFRATKNNLKEFLVLPSSSSAGNSGSSGGSAPSSGGGAGGFFNSLTSSINDIINPKASSGTSSTSTESPNSVSVSSVPTPSTASGSEEDKEEVFL